MLEINEEHIRNISERVESIMHLLSSIERHLRNSGTPPTRFGREAVNDPRFVLDLRNGRQPRPETHTRVMAYLAKRRRSIAR